MIYKRLTAAIVKSLSKPGRYGDGHGLYLRVAPGGSKQWVQRVIINGRRRDMGLGGYPLVSLAEARQAAFDNRKLARAGGDPLATRHQVQVPTFAEASESVIRLHEPNWKQGARSAEIWRSSLARYAFPRLGRMSIDKVTTADVLGVLVPIWNTKRETARRVRQRIGAVCKWAIAQGFRTDNPAGNAISAALPKDLSIKRHQRALHYSEVAGAIATILNSGAYWSTRLAFEFLVLTAARSGEVRFATWAEVDLEVRIWTVPAKRMKSRREHRVPLPDRAVDILCEAAQRGDGTGLIFPSARGKAMSDATVSKLCRENGVDAVPHGFRSSFRDWAGERTNTPRAVMEAALAHIVRGVEGAYARSDLFERRRKLMDAWAGYLSDNQAEVVRIHG